MTKRLTHVEKALGALERVYAEVDQAAGAGDISQHRLAEITLGLYRAKAELHAVAEGDHP